ncbi:SRPBCC family protein [Actinocorallia lasiicapitis]
MTSATARAVVRVERIVAAAPGELYGLVSEVSRLGRWSPETISCRWLPPAAGPAVGARFRGVNERGRRRWSTTCTVIAAEPDRCFGFDAVLARRPVSRWMYAFEPHASGCRVVETWTDLRPTWLLSLSWVVSGVGDRTVHNRATMEATLAALALATEHPLRSRP